MNLKKILTLFLFIVWLKVNGQKSDSSHHHHRQLFDTFDLINRVAGKHKKDTLINTDELKSFKPTLTMLPGIGYSQLKGASIVVAANLSYKINERTNVSVLKFVPEYTRGNYFVPRMIASFWTNNNKYNLAMDWRYYKYAAIDYGVGSSTNNTLTTDVYRFNFLRFHQVLSRKIRNNLMIGFGYFFDRHYNIKLRDKKISTNSESYSPLEAKTSSGPVLNILEDNRRNANFPFGGEKYLNISIVQNLKALGSSSDYKSLYFDYRRYFAVNHKTTDVLAFRQITWLTGGTVPYFDLPYVQGELQNDSSRPFIEGRFRGNKMLYGETEYRFGITKNEFIGGAVFLNAVSFSELASNKFEKFNIGYGGSVRVKANKKSNLYFVGSYGWSNSGGKGLFFNLGEVF